MDQKATDGQMLAITEGDDDESSAQSSYTMMPSDRKAVAETRSSSSKTENQIAENKKAFGKKGWLGLWWDAKGIFNSSDADEVTRHMEKHRKFYEAVVTFTVMVEKGDTGSYRTLLDLYEELSVMEDEAMRDARSHQSKAICGMLREFLQDKYKLDHNLKRVECVVLRQKIDDVERSNERSRQVVSEMGEDMRRLLEEQRRTQDLLRRQQERSEKLEVENETCLSMVESMQRRMEEICLDAERRADEASRRSEERVLQMAEENQRESQRMAEQNQRELQRMSEQHHRELQKITRLLSSMKEGFGSNSNFPQFP